MSCRLDTVSPILLKKHIGLTTNILKKIQYFKL